MGKENIIMGMWASASLFYGFKIDEEDIDLKHLLSTSSKLVKNM